MRMTMSYISLGSSLQEEVQVNVPFAASATPRVKCQVSSSAGFVTIRFRNTQNPLWTGAAQCGGSNRPASPRVECACGFSSATSYSPNTGLWPYPRFSISRRCEWLPVHSGWMDGLHISHVQMHDYGQSLSANSLCFASVFKLTQWDGAQKY